MSGHIILKNAEGKFLQKVELDRLPLVIGRGQDCDIRVESIKISKKHAVLEFQNNNLILKDLGSVNGLMLGSVRVDLVDLSKEKKCNLGDFEIEYVLPIYEDKTVVMQRFENTARVKTQPPGLSSVGDDSDFKTIIRPRMSSTNLSNNNLDLNKGILSKGIRFEKTLVYIKSILAWVQNSKIQNIKPPVYYTLGTLLVVLSVGFGVYFNKSQEPPSRDYIWYVVPPRVWFGLKLQGNQKEDALKKLEILFLESHEDEKFK
ncbi:MAG TPA: FHA domain-containing protein [Pseudobdellovibrionaceae bacterium]|nr:FHA domain-containing protein [Pseudobdellovibrionaceae bacterium]